jgi:hypothetical protein
MNPYKTIQELLEDSKIHGPYVVDKRTNNYSLITNICSLYGLVLDSTIETSINVQTLCNYYTWQDGSPCGKSIEV